MAIKNNASNEFGIYKMDSFQFEYGKTVENIDVEYRTSGTPRYDDEGYITNAIVFCPTYKGDFSAIKGAYEYLKKENIYDENQLFFITITSLGMPDSYCPSSTNLNSDFPSYSFKDIVNFKRQFIAEKFKIKKLYGMLGEEMGGYEVFTWACEYPDDMEFILILNSDFKISGYRFIISKGFEAIVDTIEDSYNEGHSIQTSKAVVALNTFLFAQSQSEKVFSNMSTDEIEIFLDEFVDEGLSINIYDFNFRNQAVLNYNMEDKLENIKAKTLIIFSDERIYYYQPLDVDVLKDSIDNLKVLSYSSVKENYYDEEDFSKIAIESITFLNEHALD